VRNLLAAVAVLMTLAAGCGDDEAQTSSPAGPGRVEVTAVDYAFEGVPETLEAGETTFVLTNEGEVAHEMAIGRVADDTPLEEFASGVDTGAAVRGTRRIIAAIEPGESSELTMELEPGRYVYVCFQTEGTNPQRHGERGMVGDFTVD
jgi:uncharacterized cupredoxin-like copper-binding protein